MTYAKDRVGLVLDRYSISPQDDEVTMSGIATLERLTKRNFDKAERLDRRLDRLARERRVDARRPILERLARERDLDLKEELTAAAEMDEARWSRHVARIRAHYRRIAPVVEVSRDGMTAEDLPKLVRYAREHKLTGPQNMVAAMDGYKAARKAGKV